MRFRRLLRQLIAKEPFEPFRVKLINGDGHDIAYPQSIALLRRALHLDSFAHHATIARVSEFNDPDPNDPLRDIVHQPVQHQPVSARVPERISRGLMSTGQVILDSPKEFMIDFLQGLTRPYQVVSRVVLTPATMQEFINALQQNVQRFTDTYGPPPTLNIPPPQNRPTIQEIYENFKLPEDVMTGSYCNSVLIGHSPTDFFFDFIASFYPTPAVSSRIIMQAGMVPRFQGTLTAAMNQYQQRYGNRGGQT